MTLIDAAQCTSLFSEALQLLRSGLELLDEAEAPGDIGAHVDLAISRLEAHADSDQLAA